MHSKRLKAIPFRLHSTKLMEGPYVLTRGVQVRENGIMIRYKTHRHPTQAPLMSLQVLPLNIR